MQIENGSYTYDRCLKCKMLGHGCGGPNTACMDLYRWCEWCAELKRLRGYTFQHISKETGISEATLHRIFSGHPPKDIRRETSSALMRCLVGASEWPCLLAAEDAPCPSATSEENFYEKELETVRREAQEKIDFLKREIEFLREEALKKDLMIDQLLRSRF